MLPLKPFIKPHATFFEPCAANGSLAEGLEGLLGLVCAGMSDIEPLYADVARKDALTLHVDDVNGAQQIITNPPWSRKILHEMIEHLKWVRPTWMLLDADWLFTKQAAPFLPDATHIVAIGRVRWIPGTSMDGKENSCWVRFVGGHDVYPTFHPNW